MPIFLNLAEVVELHRQGVERFGGSAEVRDMNLLQAAIGMPSQQFAGEFLHPDLGAMAAAYLFHIVMNHPFVDGNKRAGALAARAFLLLNEVSFEPTEQAYGDLVLGIVRGETTKEAATKFFRDHIK